MKKPLIKLYITLVISLALAVVFIPGIVGKTSSMAVFSATDASLKSHNAKYETKKTQSGKAHAVIIMDDGWETQYSKGYEIMSRYDMKGCIVAVPSLVGTQGYMNFGQLADVYKDGWDILNHTYSHECLTELSGEAQAEQMVCARDWLIERNLIRGADIVIFPYGAYSDVTIKQLEEKGFVAGRSLNGVWDVKKRSQREDIEICNLISHSTIEQIKAAIDKAIATGNTCILTLHKIEPVTTDDQMQIDEKLFEEVIKYLYDNCEDISVVTFSQLIN